MNYEVDVIVQLDDFDGDEEAAFAFVDAALRQAHSDASVRNFKNHPGWDYAIFEESVRKIED